MISPRPRYRYIFQLKWDGVFDPPVEQMFEEEILTDDDALGERDLIRDAVGSVGGITFVHEILEIGEMKVAEGQKTFVAHKKIGEWRYGTRIV